MNELLAMENQSSGADNSLPQGLHHPPLQAEIYNNASLAINNILDSQQSSPAVKSDVAMHTTAQFTHGSMPSYVNVNQEKTGATYQSGK